MGASGYARRGDSFRDGVGFIFGGGGDQEIIGNFGAILGGAAGDELDRFDPELGSPHTALWLASANKLDESYQLCVEDIPQTAPQQDGIHSPKVRADIVYCPRGSAGAVFSVGSVNWIGSLDFNGD